MKTPGKVPYRDRTSAAKNLHAALLGLNPSLPVLEHDISATEYERQALVTWEGGSIKIAGTSTGFVHLVTKLVGEAGEVSEKFGKASRDEFDTFDLNNLPGCLTPERRQALLMELGDVAWYIAVMAAELDSSFAEVLKLNIKKLRDRSARGVIRGDGDNR